MGKPAPKTRNSSTVEMNGYDERIDESYRPFLIHSTTYAILTEQIMALTPPERHILLTMNEYDLHEVNPTHPRTGDSPTHVIIFCIRFIADDIFQPIGALLIYKYIDQSILLAECLKAYIHDLWKLGLRVVATVSPPFETFKSILSHLVKVENSNNYSGILSYSVFPFKEIIHLYDIQFLLIKLQNLLKGGDIRFTESQRRYQASWCDLSVLLNVCPEFKMISTYIRNNTDVSRRVHVFSAQIFEQFLNLEARGLLSKYADGTAVLLSGVRNFLQFTEIDVVNLKVTVQSSMWSSLTDILETMTFQKSEKRTCTKVKPSAVHSLTKSSTRRKIDFQVNGHMNGNGDECLLTNGHSEEDAAELKSNEDESGPKKSDLEKATDGVSRSKKKRKKKKNSGENKEESANAVTDSEKGLCEDEKPKTEKKSGKVEKSECENELILNNRKSENCEKNSVDLKSCKTDNLGSASSRQLRSGFDNKIFNVDVSCDKDKNNNSEENKKNNATTKNNCDSRNKLKKSNKNKNKEQCANGPFTFQNFIDNFSKHNLNKNETATETKNTNCQNSNRSCSYIEETTNRLGNLTIRDSKYNFLFVNDGKKYFNDFCSLSDEETEKCITKSCDKVPNIIETLLDAEKVVSKAESLEDSCDDYEQNSVTAEIMSTIRGMKRVMEIFVERDVGVGKPDAFVVEHIDFLVTCIKRDKNNINPVYYYGHNYGLFNAELAFVTLQNNKGLYLVMK